MKFEEIRALLHGRFGEMSGYTTSPIRQLAFPDVVKERATVIFGLQPASYGTTTRDRDATPVPPHHATQPAQEEVLLLAESKELKKRVVELKAELCSVQQSSLSIVGLTPRLVPCLVSTLKGGKDHWSISQWRHCGRRQKELLLT